MTIHPDHRIYLRTDELRLADVVTMYPLDGRAWGACIVTKITDDAVTLFRPYGHTADFSYTGGVIAYVGIETYDIELTSDTKWKLHQRKELN